MRLLMIMFLPWAYFFSVGRPMAGAVHLVVWLISIPLLFAFGLGIFIWGIQVTLAAWDNRNRTIEEHATAIAAKMAEAIQTQNRDNPSVG